MTPTGVIVLACADRGLHFVDTDVARGERIGIDLDAHRVFLAAEDLHLRDAGQCRQRAAT